MIKSTLFIFILLTMIWEEIACYQRIFYGNDSFKQMGYKKDVSPLKDDICKQEGDQFWTCQKLSNCSSAQADLKRGKRPEICSFIGQEAVVCCQPSATVAPAAAAVGDRIVQQPKERISMRNDICKQEGDQLWTCQKLSNCSSAQADLKRGKRPEICSFIGQEAVVCCQPSATVAPAAMAGGDRIVQQPKERISMRMCKRYAEYVFKSNKVDTCALTEPIAAPVDGGSGHTPVLSSNIGPREFPHTAVLGFGERNYFRPGTGAGGVQCAGSLVSERFVLSVASCKDNRLGPAAWVRLGDYNVNSRLDDTNGVAMSVVYDIEDIIIHPEYRMHHNVNEIFYHDMALYRLSVEVQFNEYIRPICLHDGNSFMNTFAITTGWGPVEVGERLSDVVQKVNVTIVADGECSDAYKFYGEVKDGLDTDLVVCAALVDGRDTCISIPGSPLQLRLRDPYCMYSLVGVAYFGRNCFVKSPGVYIRISHYLDWIEGVVWP